MLPDDVLPFGTGDRVGVWTSGLDSERALQLERPERQVDEVAAHVAQHAVAKFPAPVPVEVAALPVALVVGPILGRAQPHVPIEVIGDRLGFELRGADRVDGTPTPDVGLSYGTDRTRLDQFDNTTVVFRSVDLRTHLGRDPPLSLSVLVLHEPGLDDGVAQGFLTVHVLATAHRGDGGERVMVVRGADDHAVDLRVLDELSPIGEDAGVLEALLCTGERGSVHVTQSADVLAGDLVQISPAAPADPDDAEIQLVGVDRRQARSRCHVRRSDRPCDCQTGCLRQEFATRAGLGHDSSTPIGPK